MQQAQNSRRHASAFIWLIQVISRKETRGLANSFFRCTLARNFISSAQHINVQNWSVGGAEREARGILPVETGSEGKILVLCFGRAARDERVVRE